MATRMIFVFGSNLAGRHGKGAALHAAKEYGAKRGVGRGRTGDAYAIPTKNKDLRVLPLDEIQRGVHGFLSYAMAHPELTFLVTAIGTGLAGYSHEQIAPMFKMAPGNCQLPSEWANIGKVHIPGIGWMTPGVCTASWCARNHGAKCSSLRGTKCLAEREAKRKNRNATR